LGAVAEVEPWETSFEAMKSITLNVRLSVVAELEESETSYEVEEPLMLSAEL